MGAPLSGPEFGYRRRARVAVRWDMKAKNLEVGFRAVASQDIVAIDECPVLVQALQPIMQRLPNMLRRLSKPQALGHVELFSGSSSLCCCAIWRRCPKRTCHPERILRVP
jgi:23S rRNA (uracil1939-C5)-methyltransferase